MQIIDFQQIADLNISPRTCVDWVRESFLKKDQNKLPPKISIHWNEENFFNTMPCFLATENRLGVKMVTRFPDQNPALKSEIMLWDATQGQCLALMDGTWITAMRTGAVAALAAHTFAVTPKENEDRHIAFIGLGNTARATLLCLREVWTNPLHVTLMRYKDQAEDFASRFAHLPNTTFHIVEKNHELLSNAEVVFSCVTAANDLFAPDEMYPSGITVVPVHTRGFQNCDLFFDKVFGDDTGHVRGFKYFDRFKSFAELSDVLTGKAKGRESDSERILSYNIGLGIHDALFASRIFDQISTKSFDHINLKIPTEKFWV